MLKILVIEDEPAIRDNILELLEAENFEAFGVADGQSGVYLAKKHLPDLILCDVIMPELDGYGVLKALRNETTTATIPFIFLTALADKKDFRQGMELGADDYLTKPCTPNELLKAIATRLQKQTDLSKQSKLLLDELRHSITMSLPHELRTPLNGIMGFSDIIMAEGNSLELSEIKEMVGYIQSSAKRLYRLIQNFLLYAELELIATDIKRIKDLRSHPMISVKEIIQNQVIQQAKLAQREADLELDLQDSGVQMSGLRLKKLVEELMDNALKFSSPGTPIRVISSVKDNSLSLSILDQGRGMTDAQIANVGAYMQFERKLYEQQGSGLGLAIVKRLVELHGGELTLESISGEQTIACVTLPTILTTKPS
ncbi:hybrid sensor histidine kinase/response regulator [Argonema antarcticum]|uniref:hybrid sensor histidine kinase/response regulator n=1 Tax=Argonema antarcticum TaxID=2942763 RepID=UPI0020122928|nr:response regulator [Argonema antarcticum]MCL1475921.1 response regulator [Argonema antarcticum A004/B2]